MLNSPHELVVDQIAEAVSTRVARQVIAQLRKQDNARLSGADSGLKNSWEEFCVQVQEEDSFFWDAFVDTVKQAIRGRLDGLKPYEKLAVWLRSDEGIEWTFDQHDKDQPSVAPIVEDNVVDLIFEKVESLANLYSNVRIRRFLEGNY